jgi:hypothetical protein
VATQQQESIENEVDFLCFIQLYRCYFLSFEDSLFENKNGVSKKMTTTIAAK